MKHQFYFLLLATILFSCKTSSVDVSQETSAATYGYWQQHADYSMEIDMDVESFKYKGKQKLVYTNNSPDVLNRVFYHLYFNAFQPGSEMEARSLSIKDPDGKIGEMISSLKPDEIGYINVTSLKQNTVPLRYNVEGTVLEVDLHKPIMPGETVTFDMVFDAQVPLQIQRSGRKNIDGIELSMAQWYPKMAEYDKEGWHADPYIGREFYGVWGNFDVKITIDKDYVIGGSGYLQNPNEIGHGYETGAVKPPKGDKLTWHFIAPNVHDFSWAADPDFIHDILQMPNGPTLHFLYQKTLNERYLSNWKKLQPKTAELMTYYNENIGQYPYKQYSVIQAGDGGMEYAMCTLITGNRGFKSLFGVTAHELAHSWFQFLLATNEAKHEWMDEGFTEYICTAAENKILNEGKENHLDKAFENYFKLVSSGIEQPQTTHADRYAYNSAYGASAYSKGAVFLYQLKYIMGEENLNATLKKYFNEWAFKHPQPNDFIRCAEKVSGLELDWYLTDWTQTINTIDYGVKSVENKTVTLERIGLMPMPIDLTVTYTDGTSDAFYIPLRMMRGEKPTSAKLLPDWAWAYPTYTFEGAKEVKSVTIDPENSVADINKNNNTF